VLIGWQGRILVGLGLIARPQGRGLQRHGVKQMCDKVMAPVL
jgi:hypothetical protein